MKKTVNINLGGFPFTIDEDAYGKLYSYLDSISTHFDELDGCSDIMQDIELRIAELFQEGKKSPFIVSNKDVMEVITIMGAPDDFSYEENYYHDDASNAHGPNNKESGKKRLFRDKDRKMIAGVASGLSVFFGIENPLWLRILFVILFLGSGMGLVIYLMIWFFVPYASTPAERLAMSGEPINVNNIAKMVEDGIETISEKIMNISNEITSKR